MSSIVLRVVLAKPEVILMLNHSTHRRLRSSLAVGTVTLWACLAGCGIKPDIPEGWDDDSKSGDVSSQYDTSPYAGHEVAAVEPIDDEQLLARLVDTDEPVHWQSIRIEKGAITNTGLEHVATHAPELKQLVLRESAIGDAGAKSIAKLEQLRVVNLPHSKLTDEGIASLVALPQVEFLRLGSSEISDRSLQLVRTSETIKFLHLIDAPITDQGLEALFGWNELESLYIDGSEVTAEGVARLVKECPDLHLHLDQKHHDADPRKGHD